jgi:hypothetical protein
MPDLTAKRTLVKSPPELWEELSEVDGLMKHLSAFGEIRITKLEPEHTVAWEGEHGSGTVSIEPSGWGTKVTLHAELPDTPDPEPVAVEPEPEAEPEPAAAEPAPEPEPEPVAAEPDPEPIAKEADPEPVAAAPDPEPIAEAPEPPRQRRGFFAWLFRTRTDPPVTAAEPVAAGPEPEPIAIEPEPEPAQVTIEAEAIVVDPEPDPEPEPKPGPESHSEPEPESQSEPETGLDPERARVVLDEALDALGAAHHRPFSRG